MQNPLTGPLAQPPPDLLANSSDGLKLRGQAASAKSRDELKKVANEFEALFVAYLLKVMRDTIEDSGLTEGGPGKGIYTELFDQELSRGIASHGMLGISDMLMKRLSVQIQAIPPEADKPKAVPGDALPAPAPGPAVVESSSRELDLEIPEFQMPVQAPVSSRFGLRKDPFTHQARFHKGLDLAAPLGTTVRSALGGQVIFAGYQPGYGNTVVLQHPDGLQTRYAHLGTLGVKNGDLLASEAVVGSVGDSGHSTGPHLHFEVLRSGGQVDPLGSLAE